MEAEYDLPTIGAKYLLQYEFTGSPSVQVTARYEPGKLNSPTMPRFGMEMAISDQFPNVTWYGRGPHETYWDRKTGGEVALYEDSVDSWNFPYVRSQDVGNRTDVRWMTLTDDDGHGVRITGAQPLSISAWPFSQGDLVSAKHPHEITQRDFTKVHIDWKVHGVGGDTSWGAKTHKQYTLPSDKPYQYQFTLTPVQ